MSEAQDGQTTGDKVRWIASHSNNHCCICGKRIKKGTEYTWVREKLDGSIALGRAHMKCGGQQKC